MDLIALLSLVKDPRRQAGRRFRIDHLLLMCILAVMSGNYGYREIGRFVQTHFLFFIRYFGLRHGVPSFITLRSILQLVDFESFNLAFNIWAGNYVGIESEQTQEQKEEVKKKEVISIDGKAITASVKERNTSYQQFVSLVSAFASKRGVLLGCTPIENHKRSEIPAVQELITLLGLKGVLYSLDALHCQKKRHK